jgi:hypothetical protein
MTTYAVISSDTNICNNVVIWDDSLGPWTPPANNYIVNINGLEVGIGWYYNPTTQVWTAPPTGQASFSPTQVSQNQTTTLSWTTDNTTNVKISSFGDQLFPSNGSQDFTFANVGSQKITITMIGFAGEYNIFATAKVVLAGTNTQNSNISAGTVI